MKPYGHAFGVVRRLVALLAPGPGPVATLALLVVLVSAVPLAVPWLIGVAFDEAPRAAPARSPPPGEAFLFDQV